MQEEIVVDIRVMVADQTQLRLDISTVHIPRDRVQSLCLIVPLPVSDIGLTSWCEQSSYGCV